jgi:hypothetical protein
LYRGLGGPQDWSGRVHYISLPPAFDPRTVQPVAKRSSDRYAILLTNEFGIGISINTIEVDYFLKYVSNFSFCLTENTVLVDYKYQWVNIVYGGDGLVNVKGKVTVTVKFTLEQTTNAQSGSRGIALLFL